jgi:hypothetical protein
MPPNDTGNKPDRQGAVAEPTATERVRSSVPTATLAPSRTAPAGAPAELARSRYFLTTPRSRTALSRDRDDVIRRALDLSRPEMLTVYEVLRDYLGAEVAGRSSVEEELTEREACRAAMRRAAEHLSRPEATAPTIRQYRAACAELDLDRTAHQIIKAWGTWGEAVRAYQGYWHHRTPAQRRQRSVALREAPLRLSWAEGLRRWLETAPSDVGTAAYDEWTRQYNARQALDADRAMSRSALRAAVSLRWPFMLAVGRRQTTPEIAHADCLSLAIEEAGPLRLGGLEIAGLALGLGRTRTQSALSRPDAPTRVAKLRSRLYEIDDLLAFAAGESFPERQPDSRNGDFLHVHQVTACLRTDGARLSKIARGDVPGEPQPAGKVGHVYYWLPTDVEAAIRAQRAPGSNFNAEPHEVITELARWLTDADADADHGTHADHSSRGDGGRGNLSSVDGAGRDHLSGGGGGVDRSPEAYVRWWQAQRDGRGSPRGYLTYTENWSLPWEQWLEVARERTPFEQALIARLRYVRERAGPLQVAGLEGLSLMLGCSRQAATRRSRTAGFPAPAGAILKLRVWHYEDLAAYVRGDAIPQRVALVRGQDYLAQADVTSRLGLTGRTLSVYGQDPALTPLPNGRVSNVLYWLPADVERWIATHERPARGRHGI